MRILRAADHRRMAWKNGGGETVEIAVHPPGAGLADFDWRVSMARVAADGPFSTFPGTDRTIAILDGAGIDLDIEGHGRHGLTVASDPLFFPADVLTKARLVGGPVSDLNVMTRRNAWHHGVRRLPLGLWTAAKPASGALLVLCCEGEAEIRGRAVSIRLQALDALVMEVPHEVSVLAEADSRFYAVSLTPEVCESNGSRSMSSAG